jgi:NAD-dependent dihydropyrimidine dehydrogenase PreA subunit
MRRLRNAVLDILQICLRGLPWPTEPRLIRAGNPGRDAPVLLPCNYAYTVRRVLHALRGLDAYLLVAPTRGINVWCAAAGGYFTAHQVISILRTSGISDRVDHRRLVLPQLSATGVERKLVEERTDWHIVFGPVYARDLPAYLAAGRKSDAMRQVSFPLPSRMEMAAAWAFPISMIGAAILAIAWRHLALPFVAMVWGVSMGLFALFPWLFKRVWPDMKNEPGWMCYLILFDPSIRRNFLLWLLFEAGFASYGHWRGDWSTSHFLGWSLASLFLVLLISMDMPGNTPIYKSGLHEDRRLHIELDSEACRGRAMCWEVCPKNCYVIDASIHKATIALPDACVQCGACVVQCPEDALAFISPTGQRIPPETIRKYKLDMLGRRATAVSSGTHEQRDGVGR